jgi:hypothetical protein
MKIILDIKTCKECPFFEQERMYTADSFEEPFDWFCKKMNNRKIRGYVEWHEEKDVPIPDWCPVKVEEPAIPSTEKIAEIVNQ